LIVKLKIARRNSTICGERAVQVSLAWAALPFRVIKAVIIDYARVDRYIAPILLLSLILFGPLIPRNADNPQLLAAFSNDEPWMTMALDGTIAKPEGNPANYLDPKTKAYNYIPAYWGTLRYPNVIYYGAAMFNIAFPFYATARLIGLPAFPTAPIILRTISTLAALISLLFVYNFGRKYAGIAVGILSCLVLLSDRNFIYYTTTIHPDTLQIYFGLLALGVALRHSNDGLRSSLAALGLMCGIVQGTKFGGPWTVPMATAALFLGVRAAGPHEWDKRSIAYRVGILGAAALVGWLGTNPYAVITSYYFHSWVAAWQVIGSPDGPLGTTTFLDWITAIYDYVGPLASALAVAGLVRALLGGLSTPDQHARFLAAILSLSLITYYALLGKLWIVLGYLLLALALTAVLALDCAVVWLQFILSMVFAHASRRIAVASVTLVSLCLGAGAGLASVNIALATYLSGKSTLIALNDWATKGGLPPNARIVFDDLAYLDPKIFKNARMYGGVLTWSGVAALDPEYIILSSSLYGSPHYANLIKTQHLAADDPNPVSMLMYQALVPTSALGPTAAAGISFIKEIAPDSRKTFSPVYVTPWTGIESNLRYSLFILNEIWHPSENPMVGPALKIYKRKPDKPSDEQH
jgi:Dolichyl-phosphate-mannose-protein mannosyltransferase